MREFSTAWPATLSTLGAAAIAVHLGCATLRNAAQSVELARPARTLEATLATSDLARVRESELRDAFPELTGENRVVEACLWDDSVPARGKAVLTPTLVAAHSVETARIECTSDGRSVTCELHRAPAYFATDPNKYFGIEDGTDVDEAITVVRLFEEGAVTLQDSAAASTGDLAYRVVEIRKMPETYLLQVWDSMYCGGCNGLLHVKPIFEGGRMVGLESDGYPAAACVIPPPEWLEEHPDQSGL